MTDEKKLTPTGRLYFDGGIIKPRSLGKTSQMPFLPKQAEQDLLLSGEAFVDGEGRRVNPVMVGIDFSRVEDRVARMYRLPREAMEETRKSFVCTIKVTDNATAGFNRLRDQLKFYQLRVYYGDRIAMLLSSGDRRQRKRGERLKCQQDRRLWDVGYNLTERQAKELVDSYREAYPDVRKFWNTNLGEPYDPERYRKD